MQSDAHLELPINYFHSVLLQYMKLKDIYLSESPAIAFVCTCTYKGLLALFTCLMSLHIPKLLPSSDFQTAYSHFLLYLE